MPAAATPREFALTQQQLDAISNFSFNGLESEDHSFNVQDPEVAAELRSRSLRDFRARDPPYTPGSRSRSVAASITAMSQHLREIDAMLQGPIPPRRATT